MSSNTALAEEIHRSAPVVDLHADTLELVRLGYRFGDEHRPFAAIGRLLGHVDGPRARRGGLSGQFFGIVIPPWSTTRSALAKVRRQAELLDGLCADPASSLVRAETAEDVEAAHRAGKVAAFLGVEGSYGLVRDASTVETLVAAGVRYLSPAHLLSARHAPSHLQLGDRPMDDRGRAFVAALERRSIIVDLAHLGRRPFLDLCEAASRPVVVSHAGVHALRPMWRNIDDDQIRAVASTGGVVGVIMTPRFLGQKGAAGVADHLAHLHRVGGEDLPALGSDFDGLVRPPSDMRDVTGLPLVTGELVERGFEAEAIRKMLGGNVLRLLSEVPPPRRRDAG